MCYCSSRVGGLSLLPIAPPLQAVGGLPLPTGDGLPLLDFPYYTTRGWTSPTAATWMHKEMDQLKAQVTSQLLKCPLHAQAFAFVQ